MAKIREEQAKTGADKTLPPAAPAVKRLNENGEEEVVLSKRKQKKMERNPHKAFSKVIQIVLFKISADPLYIDKDIFVD